MLTREDALQLVDKNVESIKKKRHMIAVSAVMKEIAKRLGLNEDEWELVGLLHDLDYDLVKGDMRKHGLIASEMLKEKLPENSLHAIRSHDYRTGIKPENTLDKALIASDCVWILIVRVAILTSNFRAGEIKTSTLANAVESKSFPPFIRSGILMCRDLGLTLEDFLKTAQKALPSELIISQDDL